MHKPVNSQELQNSALFKALLAEDFELFNQLREQGDNTSFENASLRGFDLKQANLKGLNFSGAYLRNADLRGVDLRETNLDGASIREAKLSGTFFPKSLTASEISLSHVQGTRLRP